MCLYICKHQVVDVTSLAAAYQNDQNDQEPIKQIAKKERKRFEAMKRDLKKWQYGVKLTGKMVEGPSTKGKRIAIASNKKGQSDYTLQIMILSLNYR